MKFGIKRLFVAAGLIFFGLLMHVGLLHLRGNFHETIPGEYYRSGQMSPKQLTRWTKAHGIKTVINLRGENSGEDWYDAEVATAKALGLTHLDFRMYASDHIDAKRAQELLVLMRDAEKPVLVHCQGGADRTGIATALYTKALAGWSEERAEWQLSLLYGHIGLPVSGAWPMDESWEDLESWLGITGS